MDTFVFFLVVGLLITIGVVASVRLYVPDVWGTGHIRRRIRRLRTLRTTPGTTVSSLPPDTVIEEIIDEEEPVEEEA